MTPKTRDQDTLLYLQSMTRELALMAKSAQQPLTAYLIEMAYIEVSDALCARGVIAKEEASAAS